MPRPRTATMPERAPAAVDSEAALAARWAAGFHTALRLEDGRALRVIFPGVPGGSAGPDFRGAVLDAGGDLLRGDVEIHLHARGWREHRHHLDPAYAGVVVHAVGANDTGALTTLHASGRAIPILVLPPARQEAFPPPFTPPCAFAPARGVDLPAILGRLGLRRLRMKAARVAPLVADAGPGQALYALVLETLAGSANRPAFATLARRLPLAALLERSENVLSGTPRTLALAAELRAAAAGLALRRAGLRPMASPGRRLEAAAALIASLWPAGGPPGWPGRLDVGLVWRDLAVPGVGRAMAVELAVNAVLPVALASGAIPEGDIEAAWSALPSPGTYGKLRRLEGWLGGPDARPFAAAARLQGGLLLHAEYCTKGACGRCPLSEGGGRSEECAPSARRERPAR